MNTGWWDGALTPLSPRSPPSIPDGPSPSSSSQYANRIGNVGVARRMHTELTAGLTEERITLLVRPDAPAPQHAYLSWGYRPVGRSNPSPVLRCTTR